MADEDVLARICRDTRLETATRRARTSLDTRRARAVAAEPTRGFGAALMRATADGDAFLISAISP